ncbi:MAG: hypothetical protein WCF36_11835 [Candidatus Nanopelagicales bacterium]
MDLGVWVDQQGGDRGAGPGPGSGRWWAAALADLVGEGVGHDIGGLADGEPCLPQRGVRGGMDQAGHRFAESLVVDAAVGLLTTALVEALLSESTRASHAAATDLVRDCFTRADRARMANAAVSISLRREDLTPLLGSVQAPTLFLTGRGRSPDPRAAAGRHRARVRAPFRRG